MNKKMNFENYSMKKEMIKLAKGNDRLILSNLSFQNDEDVNKLLAKNVNTPFRVLYSFYLDKKYLKLLEKNFSFTKYRELTKDENFLNLDKMERESIVKMYRLINEGKDLDTKICSLFININYKPLVEEIASYEKTPIEILEKLSKNEDITIRNKVALNKSSTSEILENLINDEKLFVRYNVAQHPNSTSEILYKLAEDEDEVVRNKAINYKSYSSELLESLIDINDFEVEFEVEF